MTMESGAYCLDAFGNRCHDLGVNLDQVITAHARFTGQTGGHDNDIGTLDIFVAVGALQADIIAVNRSDFSDVEHLALGQSFDDVEQYNVTKFTQSAKLGKNTTNLTTTDERNLFTSHFCFLLVFLFVA